MLVHVLLFDAGSDSEGIHSLEMAGKTVVLLFENPDDAERYAGLLEAQDFPVPSVETMARDDVELFCRDAGYMRAYLLNALGHQYVPHLCPLALPRDNVGPQMASNAAKH